MQDAAKAEITIYVVTCGNRFIMASGKELETAAYVLHYNQFRHPDSAEAVCRPQLITV